MDKYQYQWEWVPGVGFILSMAVVVLLGWVTGDKDKVSTSSPSPGGLGESIGRQIIPSPEPTPSVTPSPLVTPSPETFYASPSPFVTPSPPVTYSTPESSPQGSESFPTPSPSPEADANSTVTPSRRVYRSLPEIDASTTYGQSVTIRNLTGYPMELFFVVDDNIYTHIPIEQRALRFKSISKGRVVFDNDRNTPGSQAASYSIRPGGVYELKDDRSTGITELFHADTSNETFNGDKEPRRRD